MRRAISSVIKQEPFYFAEHEKSTDRFKNKIRELTRRNPGCSLEYTLQKLRQYPTGRLNYYAIADIKEFIQQANGWIKRKIRCYIWKQWKRIKSRFENLQASGIPRENG